LDFDDRLKLGFHLVSSPPTLLFYLRENHFKQRSNNKANKQGYHKCDCRKELQETQINTISQLKQTPLTIKTMIARILSV
jgi:hypothetical protein